MRGRYEPGTVAEVEGHRAMLVRGNDLSGGVARWQFEDGGWTTIPVSDPRPLAVIDLADAVPGHRVIGVLNNINHPVTHWLADQIEAQARQPKPETVSAHDGCHDKGWTEVDGLLYCNNCGFSEVSRFIKGGEPS